MALKSEGVAIVHGCLPTVEAALPQAAQNARAKYELGALSLGDINVAAAGRGIACQL
jgi:hypothetical protein